MASARTVRRLRLRGMSRASMHRLGAALEDALRVSALPGDDGRLVLLRTLALGGLDVREGSSDLPRRLEAVVSADWRGARHGGEAGAARSNAVWFRDALEAHVQLAERVLAGAPVDEWYWGLAVSGWRGSAEAGVPESLGVMVRSLAKLQEAPTALPAWCAAVCAGGGAPELMRVLTTSDGRAIADAVGFELHVSGGRGHPGSSLDGGAGGSRGMAGLGGGDGGPPRTSGGAPVIEETDPKLSRPEDRGSGQRAAAEGLLDFVLRSAARQAAAGAPGGERRAAPRSAEGHGPDAPSRDGDHGPLPSPLPHSPESPAPPPRIGNAENHRPRVVDASARILPTNSLPGEARSGAAPWSAVDRIGEPWPRAPVTEAGGLPFLVNVLERLDFGRWLQGAPEWNDCSLARRILNRVLVDVAVQDRDPGWALAIADGDVPDGSPPNAFVVPPSWFDVGIATAAMQPSRSRAGAMIEGPEALEGALDAWSTACRIWLHRIADIDLESLVLRPARLAITPTHVDTWFSLAQVDLPVRRAGLDIDPGWVPWLGRVVAFHYASGPGLFGAGS